MGFPKIGYLIKSFVFHGILHCKPSIFWVPPFMETLMQGLVTVPFWEYWTSPEKVAI